MYRNNRICIVVPAFNEEKLIGHVVGWSAWVD